MIKPDSLSTLIATCTDSRWLGDILRALGGQDIELDFGQQQALAVIVRDSKTLDDRVEDSKRRNREKVQRCRDKKKNNVTDVTDVTVTSVTDGCNRYSGYKEKEREEEKKKESDIKKEEREEEKEKENLSLILREHEHQFDVFWNEYPRKVGKKPSRDKFMRILRDRVADAQTIVDAVRRQKEAGVYSELQYVPHPLTWLNQQRWNDEILTDGEASPDRGRVTEIASGYRMACRSGNESEKRIMREKARAAGIAWDDIVDEIGRQREKER